MEYNIYGSLEQSLTTLWIETMQFVPQLVVALLILIVGWIVGGMLGGLVRRLFLKFKLDTALDKAGVDQLSERAGVPFKPARFAGALVKWFIILAFSVVAFDVLGLTEVTEFVRSEVLGYLPQVFVAVFILFAAIIVAQFAKVSLVATLRAANIVKNPEFLGKVAYVAIIALAVMTALRQLSIASEMIDTLFMGIIFALSLGAGLAFGLGGKDAAARYIDKMTKHKDSH